MGLGIRFLFGYQKNRATLFYGFFAICIALYVGSNGIGYLTNNAYIGERIGWIGGLGTALFILPFSFSYPLPRKTLSELLPLVIWPLLVFVPALLFTDLILLSKGVIHYTTGYQTAAGPYYWVMLLVFGLYWGWALINLIRQWSRSSGTHRWHLQVILVGLILSLAVSISTDIIVPFITQSSVGYIGSLFSAVWVGFTGYILLRR